MQTRESAMYPRSILFAGVLVLLGQVVPASAHRLDEYLQATRVAIAAGRVDLDIDLTPGVSIAHQVTSWIDANGDGRVSSAEALTYAQQVVDSQALSVDGNSARLALIDVRVPDIGDMNLGVGTLRLRASANLRSAAAGRHQLTLVNSHHPESSIYLANALVPTDASIQIASQLRDRGQQTLTIDFDVRVPSAWTRLSWVFGGLMLVALLAMTRRGSGPLSRSRTLEGVRGSMAPGSGSPRAFDLRDPRQQSYTSSLNRFDLLPKGTTDGSKG